MSPAVLVVLLAMAGPSRGDPAKRAEAAFEAGDYEAAAAAAGEAYAAKGDPMFLYAQAQAERFGGRCELAIEHYRQFIAAVPSSAATLAAQDNIAECEAVLGRTDDDATPDPIEPLAADPTAPVPTAPADEPGDQSRPRSAHWARDPLGGVLVGVGVGAVAVGGGLYGQARVDERAASQATEVVTYGERIDRAYTWSRAGVSLMVVGGAAIVGGVVRWAVLARKARRGDSRSSRARLRVGPSLGGVTLRF